MKQARMSVGSDEMGGPAVLEPDWMSTSSLNRWYVRHTGNRGGYFPLASRPVICKSIAQCTTDASSVVARFPERKVCRWPDALHSGLHLRLLHGFLGPGGSDFPRFLHVGRGPPPNGSHPRPGPCSAKNQLLVPADLVAFSPDGTRDRTRAQRLEDQITNSLPTGLCRPG